MRREIAIISTDQATTASSRGGMFLQKPKFAWRPSVAHSLTCNPSQTRRARLARPLSLLRSCCCCFPPIYVYRMYVRLSGPSQLIAVFRDSCRDARGSCCCQRGTARWIIALSRRPSIACRNHDISFITLHASLPRYGAITPVSCKTWPFCTALSGFCILTCKQYPSARARAKASLSHCFAHTSSRLEQPSLAIRLMRWAFCAAQGASKRRRNRR